LSFEPSVTVLVPQPRELELPDLSLDGILRRLPDLARAEAICLTGSIVRGWGNTFSDVDVYVFSDDELELPMDETAEAFAGRERELSWTRWVGIYDDWRVDLKVWATDAFERVLAPLLASPEPEFSGIQAARDDFVYRASIGRPLANDAFFERIRDLLDRSSYRRARARTLKVRSENALLDVAGQLRAGDDASARLAAMASAADVTDACLVAAGDICPSPKWLLRRLQDTPEAGITPEEYVSEVLEGTRPGESSAECALRVTRWAQSHFLRVEEQTLVLA
jgi:predicted nucleotidyltransferase